MMSSIELKGLAELRNIDSLLTESRSSDLNRENVIFLPVDRLVSGQYQPRTFFDEKALVELAASIQSEGIIQPLIARKLDADKFEIIAGERRWRAACLAGLKVVPVVVRNVSDDTALAFALIENIQREELNPMDEAGAFVRLAEQFGMTHEEIAERVGRSRSAVSNMMRLLSLPDEIKHLLRSGKIEMGHARALLSLSPEEQGDIVSRIVNENLTVRQVEKLVNSAKSPHSVSGKENHFSRLCDEWVNRLSTKFSNKVSVRLNQNGSGRMIIHVDSPDEMNFFVESLIDREK